MSEPNIDPFRGEPLEVQVAILAKMSQDLLAENRHLRNRLAEALRVNRRQSETIGRVREALDHMDDRCGTCGLLNHVCE